MVKTVVFMVEGDCEKIFIENHKAWLLSKFQIELKAIINVGGGGNLCADGRLFDRFYNQAKSLNADHIMVLTDLECDPCVTKTKQRLNLEQDCILTVSRKAIESWFLADINLMQQLTGDLAFYYPNPEQTPEMPFDEIRKILSQYGKRGTGASKPRFIKRLFKQGFSIESALSHQDISSLHYFVNRLANL